MTAMLRFALLAALAAASFPAVAEGQSTSVDSLNRPVVLLEGKVADLEQRVRELEAFIKAEPARARQVPASGDWRDLANWRQLRRGMNEDQVRALLGEPDRVEGGPVTHWYWTGSNVYFVSGELGGWSEPTRTPVSGAAPGTGETYLEAQVDDPPVLISAGPRSYPSVLERAGIGGRVVAQFVVGTNGIPEASGFQVLSSTNPAFNEPAKAMIMNSVFRPGKVRGQAVRVQMQQAVSFNP